VQCTELNGHVGWLHKCSTQQTPVFRGCTGQARANCCHHSSAPWQSQTAPMDARTHIHTHTSLVCSLAVKNGTNGSTHTHTLHSGASWHSCDFYRAPRQSQTARRPMDAHIHKIHHAHADPVPPLRTCACALAWLMLTSHQQRVGLTAAFEVTDCLSWNTLASTKINLL